MTQSDKTLELPHSNHQPADQTDLSEQLIPAGRYLHSRQWMPANSGNLSARLGPNRFLITASGSNKGSLRNDDLVTIDSDGRLIERNNTRPSNEFPLHLALYDFYPHIGAVIHTHSVAATILSRMATETLVLEGYGIVSTLDGIDSHRGRVSLPIFSNYQDYRHLAIWFRRYVVRFPENSGLLIMGHGLYTWGATIADAIRQTEALEFMIECELRIAQIAPPPED